MRTTTTITYPATPDAVSAMLADPDYQRGRLARLAPQGTTVTVEGTAGTAFTVTTSGTVAPGQLPAAAARLVRSAVTARLTEAWDAPTPDGTRTGTLSLAVSGAPVRARAALTLSPQGTSTTLTVDLDLAVTIPLLGRSIEDKALALLPRATADETRRATAYLTEH